jgi:hypothetical protein
MGGIVGNSYATIKACRFSGTLTGVSGGWSMGGIAGTTSSSIIACKNSGALNFTGSQTKMGGIVGISSGNIIACYNTGLLTTTGVGDQYTQQEAGMGGIVGRFNIATSASSGNWIKGCYMTTNLQNGITALSNLGYICGKFYAIITPYYYNRVINNYFKGATTPNYTYSDYISGMGAGHSTKFSQTAWPTTSMDGWGVGDGSADNTYWNPAFPTGNGDVYPSLYWENIQ